ncbi:hypothetical protein OG453_09990 [Streptomyces sp. NBC_01381]|nr:hypothetical protein [Streptomyces sp. NBC_01381]MCX4666993.1 hypothetical protein [Streptomyces sp. NBC_01381]
MPYAPSADRHRDVPTHGITQAPRLKGPRHLGCIAPAVSPVGLHPE